MEKIINVRNKYKHEIKQINKILDKLENGEITEFTKENHHGNLITNIKNLKKQFEELLDKVEHGNESLGENINKITK